MKDGMFTADLYNITKCLQYGSEHYLRDCLLYSLADSTGSRAMTLFLFNPCYVRTVKNEEMMKKPHSYSVILQLNHQKFKKLEFPFARLTDVIVDNETLHDYSETSCLMWMHLYFREKG